MLMGLASKPWCNLLCPNTHPASNHFNGLLLFLQALRTTKDQRWPKQQCFLFEKTDLLCKSVRWSEWICVKLSCFYNKSFQVKLIFPNKPQKAYSQIHFRVCITSLQSFSATGTICCSQGDEYLRSCLNFVLLFWFCAWYRRATSFSIKPLPFLILQKPWFSWQIQW